MSNSALLRYSTCYCEKPWCPHGCITYGRYGRCCVAFQQPLNSPPLVLFSLPDTGLLQEQAEEPPREEAVVVHNEQDTLLAGVYGAKEGEEEKGEEEKQEEDEEINLMKPRVDSKKKAKKGKMKGKGEHKRAEQSEQPDEPDDVETEVS